MEVSNIRKVLANGRGSGFPLIIAVTLSLLLILCAAMEFVRLQIISSGVKNALQAATITAIDENHSNIYHTAREGYAVGLLPDESSFRESVCDGEIMAKLDDNLGLIEEGGEHIKYAGGVREYSIHDLDIEINNEVTSKDKPLRVAATVLLDLPVRFCGNVLPQIRLEIRTTAKYLSVF